ncbi:carbohydrate-binding module family 20 domain-containing protein [Streptomyces sp. NPDC127038]|uniref:carbohydrate-binding module family 20 domain-containing protein n=1 Tax=Streptomyces sp. NPDC127038 TaxID=3347114 RepID=UPI00365CFD8A
MRPHKLVSVAFEECPDTDRRQSVCAVGSIAAPGDRNTAAAVLPAAGHPIWSTALTRPSSTSFAHRHIQKHPDGTVTRESDPNCSCTPLTPPEPSPVDSSGR